MLKLITATMVTAGGVNTWNCWLSITQGGDTWKLRANTPGDIQYADLEAHFVPLEDDLWQVAQVEGYQDDLFERVTPKALLRALALVTLDEINILRRKANLPERTVSQLVNVIQERI